MTLWKANSAKMNSKFLFMLGLAAKAGRLAIGTERVVEKIRGKSKVKLVIVASDVSQNTLKKLKNCCEYYQTEYIITEYTREDISYAVGKRSLASSVAILDENFSSAIKKLV